MASPVRYIRDWLNGASGNGASYFVEVQALDAGGTNLAAGAAVTGNFAISEGELTFVTDGNTATWPYVSAADPNAFVQVDLGSVQQVESVRRWHYYDDARTFFGTKTEVSQDGVNWHVIFDSAVSGGYAESAAGRSDPVPAYTVEPTQPVRYIRDYLNGNNENAGNQWIEIQAYDAAGTNVAAGAAVTPSTVITGGLASYVTDGDITPTNMYETEFATSSYITVDLGAVFEVAGVTRTHYYLAGRTYNGTKTEVSPDGVNWYTAFDSAVSGLYSESSAGRYDRVPSYEVAPPAEVSASMAFLMF